MQQSFRPYYMIDLNNNNWLLVCPSEEEKSKMLIINIQVLPRLFHLITSVIYSTIHDVTMKNVIT